MIEYLINNILLFLIILYVTFLYFLIIKTIKSHEKLQEVVDDLETYYDKKLK